MSDLCIFEVERFGKRARVIASQFHHAVAVLGWPIDKDTRLVGERWIDALVLDQPSPVLQPSRLNPDTVNYKI